LAQARSHHEATRRRIGRPAGGSVSSEARRERLRGIIRARGFVSLPDLRDQMQVSESTIRRDLDLLEEQGEAQRTHGGVFCTAPTATLGLFEDRSSGNWEQKRRIAEVANQWIDEHDTILLDGGSTTYELARQLVHRRLQVVTNSLPVANLLASSPTTELILLGGLVDPRTGVMLGEPARQSLQGLQVQKAFLSIAGADSSGYYNSNLLLVELERAMLQAAQQTFIVADSSKFGRTSLARLCELSQVAGVISDAGLSTDWQQLLGQAHVRCQLAPSNGGPGDTPSLASLSIPTPPTETLDRDQFPKH
jgi:DeoR family transcriptional regulator, fructose operon transcriptional repressor